MTTTSFVCTFTPSTALGPAPHALDALRVPRATRAMPRKLPAVRSIVRASETSPVGIGVIGCGRIGQVHAKTISSLQSAELVMVADPFEKFGRKVASDYSTVWTPEWKDMLTSDKIKGIVIGSPTPFHAEQIIQSAEAGKDIFCEKPISNDLATIDKCLDAVKANGVRLLVGFQRRFDSNFMNVRSQIGAGAVGDVRMFHIVSRDPSPPPASYLAQSGGIFLDMMSHDVDICRFMTGSEVESVFVTGAAFEEAAQEANDLDTAIVVLTMKNGSFGTIDLSRRCAYGYDQRIEVFGSKGSISSANKAPNTVSLSSADGISAGLPYSFFMDRYEAAYAGVMTSFVDMMREDTAPPVTGLDGRAPIVVAMAAAKSYAEKRPVRVEECDIVKVQS